MALTVLSFLGGVGIASLGAYLLRHVASANRRRAMLRTRERAMAASYRSTRRSSSTAHAAR